MWRESDLELSWLAAFDAAARHLNFTKAADELGLTQGAISVRIRKLEQALDAALFERRGRHVVLTDEGLAYHPHVADALNRLSLSTSRFFAQKGRRKITMSCYSPSFADLWLVPKLPALFSEFPDLEFSIVVDYQSSGARADRDDLIFSYENIGHAGIVPLVDEEITAVCSPEYLAQHGDGWLSQTLIEPQGPRLTWPAWRAAMGLGDTREGRVIQVNTMQAALRLARAGVGTALVASPFCDQYLRNNSLVTPPRARRLPGKMHGLSIRQLEGARPVVKRVARWLVDAAGQEIPTFLAQ
ncbi:LysR family transcriptional regulator [Tritonibacter aquimaris]|uniref:LysR family transcriptional regulator n=1 Tax=Tritonibacter aquimaris TaxID=2663379 RepID=UPI0018862425|nr:LysR family transcriptional regulator [Tritonibacter aquimaris]